MPPGTAGRWPEPPRLPERAQYRPLRRHGAPHPCDELLRDVTPIVLPRGIVRALMHHAFHADTPIQRENRVTHVPGRCVACDLEQLVREYAIDADA